MSTCTKRPFPFRFTMWMIVLACILPALLTALYFYVVPQWPQAVRRPLFSLAKIVQFTLPILWLLVVRLVRGPAEQTPSDGTWRGAAQSGAHTLPQEPPARAGGERPLCGPSGGNLPADRNSSGKPPKTMGFAIATMLGVAFGLAVAVAILVGYRFLFAGHEQFRAAAGAIGHLLAGYRVASTTAFLVLGVFYSLAHSGLEEYYWRWFVFGQMRRGVSAVVAMIVSSAAFTLHHIVLLGYYFGWGSLLQLLFSLAVAVGGLFWAWLYHHGRSLWACWLSHLVVDAALFTAGYWMVAPLLESP